MVAPAGYCGFVVDWVEVVGVCVVLGDVVAGCSSFRGLDHLLHASSHRQYLLDLAHVRSLSVVEESVRVSMAVSVI